MRTVRRLLPAFGAGFAFTLGGSGEKLAFQPTAGSSLTKSYTIGGDFSLDDISLIVDGQDIGGMMGDMDINVKQESRIEVTDSYKAVASGRPTELLRTFEAISGSMHMEMSAAPEDIPEITSGSTLEGKTVAFKWNDEKQAYELSFHESSGDEELLEGLEEDMDLRVFLPSSEVAADESWTVELEQLTCLLMPGGNLRLMPEDAEMDDEGLEMFEDFMNGFGEEFGDQLEGECTCTFKGTREEDGAQLAEVGIELEVATTLNLSEFLDKAIRAVIEENDPGVSVEFTLDTADLSVDYEGSGTLLWNLAAGRVHSFQLSGDATIGFDLGVSVEAEGESHDVSAALELAGSLREDVTTRE